MPGAREGSYPLFDGRATQAPGHDRERRDRAVRGDRQRRSRSRPCTCPTGRGRPKSPRACSRSDCCAGARAGRSRWWWPQACFRSSARAPRGLRWSRCSPPPCTGPRGRRCTCWRSRWPRPGPSLLIRPERRRFWATAFPALLFLVAIVAWGMFVRARRELISSLEERAERAETSSSCGWSRPGRPSDRTDRARDARRAGPPDLAGEHARGRAGVPPGRAAGGGRARRGRDPEQRPPGARGAARGDRRAARGERATPSRSRPSRRRATCRRWCPRSSRRACASACAPTAWTWTGCPT